MAEVTYYVALPFVASDDGVAASEPTECFNPAPVVMRAEALPATGDFSDAKVIRKFGDVPDDLSAL
jgi:hypothetical protein